VVASRIEAEIYNCGANEAAACNNICTRVTLGMPPIILASQHELLDTQRRGLNAEGGIFTKVANDDHAQASILISDGPPTLTRELFASHRGVDKGPRLPGMQGVRDIDGIFEAL
jgi:hypothetical protein